jgi:RNA recognition motif-containing protein
MDVSAKASKKEKRRLEGLKEGSGKDRSGKGQLVSKKDGRGPAAAALPVAARKAALAAVQTAAEVQAVPVERTKRATLEKDDEPTKRKKDKTETLDADGRSTEAAVIVEGDIDSEGEEGAGERDEPELTLEEVEERCGRTMHKDPGDEAESAIAEGRRVYIANLPFSASDVQVRACFRGEITSIHWLTSRTMGFRGTGFLIFRSAAEAEAAVALTGSQLGGRAFTVDLAASTRPAPGSCVFVRNLPSEEWSLESVRRIFGSCGPILAIRLPKKGKAAIRFKDAASARAAAARDGEDRNGKKVRVLPANELADPGSGPEVERRRHRSGAAASVNAAAHTAGAQQPRPSPGEAEYRSAHAMRGGPRERAHSRQRRPRQTAAAAQGLQPAAGSSALAELRSRAVAEP